MKDNESLAVVMLPILETKLPGELREKWELKVATTFDKNKCKIDIESFFNFLEVHVISKEARNQAEGRRTSSRFHKGKTSQIEEQGFSASGSLNRTESKPTCGFCSKPHDTEMCKVALEKSPDGKVEYVEEQLDNPDLLYLSQTRKCVVNVIIIYFMSITRQVQKRKLRMF